MITGLIRYYGMKRKKLCRWFVILMVTVPIRRKIAKYLRARRIDAGLTVKDAALKTGVPERIIRSTEKAWYSIPLCTMTSLVDGYGADKFYYTMFINRLGMAAYRRKRTLETKCGLLK